MVTGRLVEYDPATRRYHLPAAHAACLTREAAPDNMAAFAQYIPLFGTVEDGVVRCFEEGGGLPYSALSNEPMKTCQRHIRLLTAATLQLSGLAVSAGSLFIPVPGQAAVIAATRAPPHPPKDIGAPTVWTPSASGLSKRTRLPRNRGAPNLPSAQPMKG